MNYLIYFLSLIAAKAASNMAYKFKTSMVVDSFWVTSIYRPLGSVSIRL